MRYHVWTIGCQMNTADSRHVGVELERLGYRWTDHVAEADVVVLNTCVVRQQAEDKIYGRLGAVVSERRPGAVLALMGCLVGHKPGRDLAHRFPHVDVFVPPSETGRLVDFLRLRDAQSTARDLEDAERQERWSVQDGPERTDDLLPSPAAASLPAHERGHVVTAHVPIVYGCNRVCSFCIIPSRRGPERSRPADEVHRQVLAMVDEGVREVTLLGQIVDRYGHDQGETEALAALLERLDAVPGLARIRFLTSHPAYMTDGLLDAVAGLPKVMEHLEVPVQAGNDEVLTRMRRGYTADEYRRLVDRIRTRVPGSAIHTDVIVGFPGETSEQFDDTYRLLAELRLDKAHIARFSSRPGTLAAKLMTDDVPEDEKERRRLALDGLQAGVCAEINASHVGRTVEVLVEGRSHDRWRGRTRTNKLVFFPDDRDLLGRVVDVTVEWSGPWSMIGRTADAAARKAPEPIALQAT